MKHLEPLAALGRGQGHAARGEAEAALENLARAETLALEMGMRPLVLEARRGAAQVLAGLGREEDPAVKLTEAHAMVEEIGGLFEDDDMRRKYMEHAAGKLG